MKPLTYDATDPQIQKVLLFALVARSAVRRRVDRLMRAEIRKAKERECQK
jgi:hypothetical protein